MLNPIANPTFDEAMAGPDRDKWIAAMEEHALSLGGLGTFGPPLSKDQCPKRPIKGRWVLVIKDDGRYKARWVTQGFRQKEGIDFDANKCHADVARMASIRTVIALAAVQNATVSGLDIKDFYVTTPIDTDMYVQLPHIPGHDYSSGDHARLRKCLFGMRQSGRLAADKLDTVMTKMGFTQLKTDPCIYTREGIHVAVFVDDLLLATATTACARRSSRSLRHTLPSSTTRTYPATLACRSRRTRPALRSACPATWRSCSRPRPCPTATARTHRARRDCACRARTRPRQPSTS